MNNKILHLFVFLMFSFSLSSYGMKLTEAVLCTVDDAIQQQQDLQEIIPLEKCIAGERCIIFETEDDAGSKKHFVFSLQDAKNIVEKKDYEKSVNDGAYRFKFQLKDEDKKIITDAHTTQEKGRGTIKQNFSDILQQDMQCTLSFIQQSKVTKNGQEIIEDVTKIIKIKEQTLKDNLAQLISKVHLQDDIDTKEVYFTFQQENDPLPKVMQAGIDSRIKQMFTVVAPAPIQKVEPKEKLSETVRAAVENINTKVQGLSNEYNDLRAAEKTKKILADVEVYNRYVKKIEDTKKEIPVLTEKIKKNESLAQRARQGEDILSEIDLFDTNLDGKWNTSSEVINRNIREADHKLDQCDEKIDHYKQALNKIKTDAELRYREEFTVNDTDDVDIVQKYQQACDFTKQFEGFNGKQHNNLQIHIMSTIKALHPKLDLAQLKPEQDVIAQIKESSPDIAQFFKNMNIKIHPDKNGPVPAAIFNDALKNLELDLKTAIPFYKSNKKDELLSQQRKSAENWQFAVSCGQASLMPTAMHEIGTFITSGLEYCFPNKQDQKDIDFLRQDTESLKITEHTLLLSAYNKLHKRLNKKTTTQALDRMSKILEDY